MGTTASASMKFSICKISKVVAKFSPDIKFMSPYNKIDMHVPLISFAIHGKYLNISKGNQRGTFLSSLCMTTKIPHYSSY